MENGSGKNIISIPFWSPSILVSIVLNTLSKIQNSALVPLQFFFPGWGVSEMVVCWAHLGAVG